MERDESERSERVLLLPLEEVDWVMVEQEKCDYGGVGRAGGAGGATPTSIHNPSIRTPYLPFG